MPQNTVTYKMLISCPSDVTEFLQQIKDAVDSFNNSFGEQNNIQLRTIHWSKNAYSLMEKGKSGQDIINQEIVDPSDMMVSVLWTRFGTPTDEYGSGTEEELNRMLEAKKTVFLFFLDKPISPSEIDIDQLTRVQDFKNKLSKNKYGLYFIVKNESSLAITLREQLDRYFTDILSKEKGNTTPNPKSQNSMSVLWVDDKPENNIYGREILENSGIEVFLATSTNQALSFLNNNDVSVIISDMGRKEGAREGYVLLDTLRSNGNKTPFIFFATSRRPEHIAETKQHGGQGCTNDVNELIHMVRSFVLNTYDRSYCR